MIILGIDPGFSGGIASIDHAGLFQDFLFMPTVTTKRGGKKHKKLDTVEICNYLYFNKTTQVIAGIELVHAMPKNGAVAMFNFGKGAGILEGVLLASLIPMYEITPQAWKKYFKLSSNKEESIIKAKQLWPSVDFNKKKDEAKAEALLIAEYTRLKYVVGVIK